MSMHASRVHLFRLKGVLSAIVLSVLLSGCYTRQIEGIQKDLDLMDRKLHKAKLSEVDKSSAVSPQEIIELKRKLESVESQQKGLSSDLQILKADVVNEQPFEAAALAESLSLPGDVPSSQEIEMLRKQVNDNQRQLSKFEREMKEMQATFDEVKSSMLDVIQLIKEEYIEETPTQEEPVSGASTSSDSSSVSMGNAPDFDSLQTAGGKMYEVKAGDSLNLIAKRFGVSVAQLKEMNQITNPDRLIMGQKILIP